MKALTATATLIGAAACSAALVLSPVAAALPVAAFLFWSLFKLPAAGVLIPVIVFPLQRSVFGFPGYIAAAAITVLAFSRSILAGGNRLHLPPVRTHSTQYLACALIAYASLSLYVRASIEQNGGAFPNIMNTEGPTFFKYLFHTLLLFLTISIFARSMKTVRAITWIHLGLLGVLSLLGIEQVISGDDRLLNFYFRNGASPSVVQPAFDRITAVFYDPNLYCNFLVSTILLCLPLLYLTRGRRFLLMCVSAVLAAALICVYFTFSVTNWLALIVGFLAWIVLSRSRKSLFLIGIVILLAIALSGNGVLSFESHLPPDVGAKIDALLRLDLWGDSPVHIRTDLISAGMELFRSNPLFGRGYGSFQPLMSNNSYYMQLTKNIVYPHNSYVLTLAELGVTGMVLLLLFLGTGLSRGFRAMRLGRCDDTRLRLRGLFASVVASLVFQGTYGSIYYNLSLWIPLSMILAIAAIVDRENRPVAAESGNRGAWT